MGQKLIIKVQKYAHEMMKIIAAAVVLKMIRHNRLLITVTSISQLSAGIARVVRWCSHHLLEHWISVLNVYRQCRRRTQQKITMALLCWFCMVYPNQLPKTDDVFTHRFFQLKFFCTGRQIQ